MTTGGGRLLATTFTRASPIAAPSGASIPSSDPAAAISATPAVSGRVFMTKSEVESTFVGKKHVFTDVPSGSVVRWDVREGGRVFYNNMTSRNNGSGTWEILDDGGFCVRMDGGRQCNYFFHEGEKLVRATIVIPPSQYAPVSTGLSRLAYGTKGGRPDFLPHCFLGPNFPI